MCAVTRTVYILGVIMKERGGGGGVGGGEGGLAKEGKKMCL